MGKDDSDKPITKKLKQSQLSFLSPKGNSGLKSKTGSPVSEGAVCQTKKHVLTEIVDLTESPRKVDKSLNSSTEKTETSKKNDCNYDKENSLENPQVYDLSKSSNDDEPCGKGEECMAMEVDYPVPDSGSDPLQQSTKPDEASSSEKRVDMEGDSSVDSRGEKDTELEIGQTESHNEVLRVSDQDISENDIHSPSKSDEMSLSSDSEQESGATSSGSTPVTPKTPGSQTERKMTPKMIKRHEESIKRKQLQKKLKEEKRARIEQERNEKLKLKLEEEQKKKEMKEEKKKKRLAEMELKNEEKRQKKEGLRLKKEMEEEEKRKKKEQKEEELKKEEEKKEQEVKKKEKAQAVFAAFFKKQPSGVGGSSITMNMLSSGGCDIPYISSCSDTPAFMPFPLKSDMRLADVNRRTLSCIEKERLDTVISDHTKDNASSTERPYLVDLKRPDYTPRMALPTWSAPDSEELHDCIIIEAQVEEENGVGRNSEEVSKQSKHTKTTRRAKLLQFCENRRPAYFGTWTKRSKHVSGRKPFAKDEEGMLDYEVDSDSEWEEEEEGEDLDSVKDDENEGQEEETDGAGDAENGYLLDNTFVPHGYLSDEEQPDEEQMHESMEKQKDRLVALKEEFDEEMKQGGAQALKPKLLGCLWVSNSTTQVSRGSLYEVLLAHRAVWDESENPMGINMEPEPVLPPEKSPTQTPSSKQLPHLILQEIARMVDGSRWPLSRLVGEVAEVLSMARPQNPVSRLALTRTIKNMASKTLDSKENSVWTVKTEFRSMYDLSELEDILTPAQVAPTSKGKNKETLLDNFLRGSQKSDSSLGAPPAKKRISLTPVLPTPPEVKTDVTPTDKKKPESAISKKKVAFVTLPPRTPGNTPHKESLPRTPVPWSSSGKQSGVKPHVDTPRPPTNRFLNKTPDSTPDTINDTDM